MRRSDIKGVRSTTRGARGNARAGVRVAVLTALCVLLFSGCNGAGDGVGGPGQDPPPSDGLVSVSLAQGTSIDSGILEVPYSTQQAFERCRLRLHGVTVAVDEDVAAGDHTISFARVQPNTSYPVDVLCSDENGMTHDRGQITDDFAFSMQDFRSNAVNVMTGPLEPCVFTPVQDYATTKGNLPVAAFAPLDSGCYWNPDEDATRDELDFVLPEEIEMIDWLSAEARAEGMSDHTISTLLARVAGPEELLSRDLVWWDLSPRIWEDEINFAQRGWNLYRQNVSRGWQDGAFDLDYRILGLMNEFWPADYNLPGTLSVPSETGIPQNPGSVALGFLNLAEDYLNDSQTWLGLLGFPTCGLNGETKPIFGHDQFIDTSFALEDPIHPNGIPLTWWLPTEGLVSRLSSQTLPGAEQNDDLIVTVDVTDHSRDLFKGAPALLRVVNAHVVSRDIDGDGAFELSETDFSAGMVVTGYSGDRDGAPMLYTNANHLNELDYNIVGPHVGRLEARKWSYAGAVSLDDTDSPGYTWGIQQNQFGMVDSEMIERGFGFVGLGKLDSKYARIAGTSGTGLLVDLSIYGIDSPAGSDLDCAPYELVLVDPE